MGGIRVPRGSSWERFLARYTYSRFILIEFLAHAQTTVTVRHLKSEGHIVVLHLLHLQLPGIGQDEL